jgi:multiple sugar transport system ATP-binding protein
MANVRFKGVQKAYGDVRILHGIDLEIRDGEFMVFVGPSGCGKSTLLRTIAGLEDITGGTLRIGDRVVNDVPPAERGIAMVFQSYALYPHMNLYDNMAFGLKLAKLPKAEIDRAVMHAARRSCTSSTCCSASPRTCPAASASAWRSAAPSCASPRSSCSTSRCPTWTPRCACDALRVRQAARGAQDHHGLRHARPGRGHDLADRIVVLNAGRIEQVGTPLELYEHPATCSWPASSAARR